MRRVHVGCGDGELRHLAQEQQVRQEVQGIGADEIVLNVDAVQGDVRETGPLAVDGGVVCRVESTPACVPISVRGCDSTPASYSTCFMVTVWMIPR